MPERLPYRPLPYPHEGLNGFLLRLAEGNGCNGTLTLTRRRPVTSAMLIDWLGRGEISQLGQLLKQLEPRKPSPRPIWNHQTSRYCPMCLNEESTWRQEWELTLLTACPIHGCRLVEICQDCGKQITWRRMKLLFCDCGAKFSSSPSTMATSSERIMAAAIKAKLSGSTCAPALIRLLNIEQLYQLIVVLGVYAMEGYWKNPSKLSQMHHLCRSERLVSASSEILTGWPNRFNAMLDRLRENKSDQSSGPGPLKQFNKFYSYVFAHMNSPEFGFLLCRTERYIIKHWPYPSSERPNLKPSLLKRSSSVWLPVSVVVKELATSHKRLVLLANVGLIRLHNRKTQAGEKVLCINQRKVADIRLLLTGLIDIKTACALLKISVGRVNQLLGSANFATTQTKNRRLSRPGVQQHVLQKILQVARGLPMVEEINCEEMVRMDYVLHFWLNQPFLFPELIKAAMNKEISPIAIATEIPAVPDWIFDRIQLRAWIDGRLQGRQKGFLTIHEVAERLGMRSQRVSQLISKNLIEVTYDEYTSSILISDDEVERLLMQ